jgi:TolA-binding protein
VWLERALTLDPSNDDARLMLGTVRECEGDLQTAGRLYLDYLKRHPDSVAAMLRLGVTAHRAGRDDVARNWLQRVVTAAPNSDEAVEARKFLVLME